jgi:hypothetical protein
MAKQTINLGTSADDHTGSTPRAAGTIINANFTEIYGVSGILKSNGSTTLSAATAGTDYYAPGSTDVAVADGGTGASTAAGARTNIGVVIGTDVQAFDSDLATIAALTATTDSFLQSKSSAWTTRTPTHVTADLIAMVGDSGSGGTKGLVPAPAAGDAAASKYLKADGTWSAVTGGGSGTVTSVGATVPAFLSISGSPITTSGTLAFSYSGTALPVANGGTGGTTAAGARTALGLAIGTDVQAYSANLAALAGVTSAANKLFYFTGSGTGIVTDFTATGISIAGAASASAVRTIIGTVIGTDVQAYDAELAALAGLTSAADKVPYFTGSGTASTISKDTAATASTLSARDSNANGAYNNVRAGYTTTATAAGTTTLTVGSTYLQFFTGSTTQTVQLPDVTTLVLGHQFYIRNNSTGLVTITSSGANTVRILGAGTRCMVTCIAITGTGAGSWSANYLGAIGTDGKTLSYSNSLTLAGTDGTTLTFQGTDTYVGRATTDTLTNKTFDTAGTGNSFKINGTAVTTVTGSGANVLGTSPTITTPVISSIVNTGTLTLPTSTDTLVGRATTDTLTNKSIAGSQITGAVTGLGATMTTARLLGRTTASTGAIEEISIGSGLTLSAGSLSASGGGGGNTVTLFSSVADATVGNTTTETTLVNTTGATGSMSISANTLAAGDVLHIRGTGYSGNNGGSWLNVRIKFGSTTICSIVSTSIQTTATTQLFTIDAMVTVRTIGASGTMVGGGNNMRFSGTKAADLYAITAATVSSPSVTVDTTATTTLDVTAQHQTANASNTVTIYALSVVKYKV